MERAGTVFDASLNWYLQTKKQLEEADKNNDETLRAQAQYDMGQARELIRKNLQANKQDINSIGKDGKLPLQKAIWTQDKEIVDEFIRAGADVRAKDASGNTVMHTAVYSGTSEIVSAMLNTDAKKDINEENDNGKTPLSLVTGNTKDDDKKRSMLLQYGAAGNASNLDVTIEHAISNATGQHKEGGMNALKNMVNAGTLNETYLFDHLTKEKDPEVFKQKLLVLKEAGVDLSAKDAKNGDTLLHRIAGNANKEMILAAKEAGVDASIKNNNGETPDHVAARAGNMAASSALGTWQINEPDNNGRTPIMIAAEKGDVNQFNQLLALGGDPAKRDDNGMSSLTITQNKDIAIKCIQEGVTNRRFRGLKNDADSFDQSVDYYMQDHFHMTYQEMFNEAARDAAAREDITALKKMAFVDEKAEAGMMNSFVNTERQDYIDGKNTGFALQVLSKNGIYRGIDRFEIEDQDLHLANRRNFEKEAFAETTPSIDTSEKSTDIGAAVEDFSKSTAEIVADTNEQLAQTTTQELSDTMTKLTDTLAHTTTQNRETNNEEISLQDEVKAMAANAPEKKKIMVHGYSEAAYIHAKTRLDGLVKKDPKMAKTVDNLRKNYKEMEEKGLLPKGENGKSNADIYAYKMCMANALAHPEEKVKDQYTGEKISFKEQIGGNHREAMKKISAGKSLTEEDQISIAQTTLGVEQHISDTGQLISDNGVKGMSYNTKALAGNTVKLEEVELSAPITPENKSMMAQNDPKNEKPEEKSVGKESPVSAPNLSGTLTLNSDGQIEINNNDLTSTLTQNIVFDKANSYG